MSDFRGCRIGGEIVLKGRALVLAVTRSCYWDLETLVTERGVRGRSSSLPGSRGRHLLRATNYRALRARAFGTWDAVTCA